MFRTIVRREIQETGASFTLLSALAALTILVPLSAYIQARYYRHVVKDYSIRQSIHQTEYSSQSIVLIRPVPPLAPFFNGAYDSLPDEFRLRNDTATTNTPSGDITPLDWLFPKIDLSFIIGVLMTLLTILLAHGAIAGDREQGTLKLILAGPIQRRTVLAAKVAGVILPTTVVLIYIVILYTTVVTVFSEGSVDLSGANLSALTVFTLVAIVVLIATAALGVAVSASARRSSVSLFVCASIWIVTILIWPPLGPYMASSLKPVSTTEAFQRDMISKEKDLTREELAEHRKTAADLKAQQVGVEAAWQRYLELRRRWINRRNEEIGRLLMERKKQTHDQQVFARRISLFSPYMAFKEVLGALCGTGLESYDEFLAAVERYRQQKFIPEGFDLLSRQKPWLKASNPDDRLQLPSFQAPSPTLSERLAAAAWPLSILIAEMVILTMLGLLSFERYDVRGWL
jgi:ABC-type transport system involved in multi-copper enzyme maturation permease subunit